MLLEINIHGLEPNSMVRDVGGFPSMNAPRGRKGTLGPAPERRRVKKERYPPADPQTVFAGINEIRDSMGLTVLQLKESFQTLMGTLMGPPIDRDTTIGALRVIPEEPTGRGGFLALSLLSAFDIVDDKMSTYDLLNRWIADPSKCPVVLAPANFGYVDCTELGHGSRRFCLITAFIYK
jgi:hypothetical protein